MIGYELDVLAKKVGPYGWDRDRGTKIYDRIMKDWMDALDGFPLEEVRGACREWLKENPRKMPHEGDILSILNRGYSEDDLTVHQKSFLRDGLVPPSMQVDGQPNRAARHWLKIYHGIEA